MINYFCIPLLGTTLIKHLGLVYGFAYMLSLPELHPKHLRLNIFCAGVQVEVKLPAVSSAPRIKAAEDLGALPLFETYSRAVDMSPNARARGIMLLQVRQPSSMI